MFTRGRSVVCTVKLTRIKTDSGDQADDGLESPLMVVAREDLGGQSGQQEGV